MACGPGMSLQLKIRCLNRFTAERCTPRDAFSWSDFRQADSSSLQIMYTMVPERRQLAWKVLPQPERILNFIDGLLQFGRPQFLKTEDTFDPEDTKLSSVSQVEKWMASMWLNSSFFNNLDNFQSIFHTYPCH